MFMNERRRLFIVFVLGKWHHTAATWSVDLSLIITDSLFHFFMWSFRIFFTLHKVNYIVVLLLKGRNNAEIKYMLYFIYETQTMFSFFFSLILLLFDLIDLINDLIKGSILFHWKCFVIILCNFLIYHISDYFIIMSDSILDLRVKWKMQLP